MPKKSYCVTNMKDPDFQVRQLCEAVELCIANRLFAPALMLIASGIDALSNGNKDDYIRNLEDNFPKLCGKLGALLFYSKYRNGIIHEFSPKKGFGIAEDYELKGEFIANIFFEDLGKEVTFLNIEKFAERFLEWLRSGRGEPPKGGDTMQLLITKSEFDCPYCTKTKLEMFQFGGKENLRTLGYSCNTCGSIFDPELEVDTAASTVTLWAKRRNSDFQKALDSPDMLENLAKVENLREHGISAYSEKFELWKKTL